ncbi:MAG: hypothetical protein JWO22_1762 [Frankiales bacterium]|nr:hypothetical protein [Frankiales bacterium]
MTETMMAPADHETGEEGTNRKPLIIAGCAGAALLLLGGGFLLLKGGGSDASLAPVVQHVVKPKHAAPAKTTAKPLGSPAKVKQLPAASSVQLGRDPFAALYVQPVAAPAGAAAGPAAGTGTGTATGTGTTTTTTTAAEPVAPARYGLTLVRVYATGKDRTAVLKADGESQLARAGSTFGKTGELQLLSFQQISPGRWSVVIKVGDDDPKDLAQGETISVM